LKNAKINLNELVKKEITEEKNKLR
jgi:hypothetical protein